MKNGGGECFLKKIRLAILIATTIIFCILSDIYIAVSKQYMFSVSPWKLYHVGYTISIILLLVWYIYEIRLFLKERGEKKEK